MVAVLDVPEPPTKPEESGVFDATQPDAGPVQVLPYSPLGSDPVPSEDGEGPLSPDMQGVLVQADDMTDDVHTWPQGTRHLPVLEDGEMSQYGYYVPNDPADPTASRIVLNPNADSPLFILLHEQGHYFDNAIIGGDAGMGTETGATVLDDWRAAVHGTDNYRQLVRLRDNARANGLETADYYDYVLSEPELWARSYSQYIASEADVPAIDEELNFLANVASVPTQWPEAEFDPIGQAVEAIFEHYGLEA